MVSTRKRPPSSSPKEVKSSSIFDNAEVVEAPESEPFEELPLVEESEEIDVSQKVKADDTVMVDFITEDVSKEFFEQKAPESKAPQEENRNVSSDELRRNISSYEAEKSEKMTFADFKQTAEFLLNFIDMVFSTAMRYWAKDTSASAYELPREKRRSLENQLAMILAKHQAKFAIELIFLGTLVAAYSGPFMKAKALRDAKKGKKPVINIEEQEMVTSTNTFGEEEKKIKRKPGKPSKH